MKNALEADPVPAAGSLRERPGTLWLLSLLQADGPVAVRKTPE